jgi:hypothetical protein
MREKMIEEGWGLALADTEKISSYGVLSLVYVDWEYVVNISTLDYGNVLANVLAIVVVEVVC